MVVFLVLFCLYAFCHFRRSKETLCLVTCVMNIAVVRSFPLMESNETTFVPFSLSLWKLQMQVASLLFLGPFLFLTLYNEELSGLQVHF